MVRCRASRFVTRGLAYPSACGDCGRGTVGRCSGHLRGETSRSRINRDLGPFPDWKAEVSSHFLSCCPWPGPSTASPHDGDRHIIFFMMSHLVASNVPPRRMDRNSRPVKNGTVSDLYQVPIITIQVGWLPSQNCVA